MTRSKYSPGGRPYTEAEIRARHAGPLVQCIGHLCKDWTTHPSKLCDLCRELAEDERAGVFPAVQTDPVEWVGDAEAREDLALRWEMTPGLDDALDEAGDYRPRRR